MSKILIIEDEEAIADLEKDYLELSGFEVEIANRGDTGLQKAMTEEYDLIILDLMLPEVDGFDICKQVRQEKNTPIIMVSAKKDDIDKIRGLGLGADDYMTKPFNPLELTARVKSQLRRYTQLGSTIDKSNQAVYAVGGLSIDDEQKEVTVDGEPVRLTPIEYNILLLLVKNQGKVFSIDQIYESIWNEDAIGVDNTVAVHIRHIREKIEINPKEPRYLKVVWGVGYKIENAKSKILFAGSGTYTCNCRGVMHPVGYALSDADTGAVFC